MNYPNYDTTVSAVPADLLGYGSSADPHADQARQKAQDLIDLRTLFVNTNPDPTILSTASGGATSVPDLGTELQSYAASLKSAAKYASDVGRAFALASGGTMVDTVYTSEAEIERWYYLEGLIDGGKLGAKLAQDLIKAIDSGDQQKVLDLLKDISDHQGDPQFALALFTALGPKYTLLVAEQIQGDDDLLAAFDITLATATNTPGWNPDFTKRLFDIGTPLISDSDAPPYIVQVVVTGNRDAGRRLHDTLLLLQYGVYSEGFLTAAGDGILFSNQYSLYHPPFDDQPNALDPVTVIADALSRNGDAAFHFLTGAVNPPSWWPHPGGAVPRASLMLELSRGWGGMWLQGDGFPVSAGDAVGRMFTAAFSSPTGQTDHRTLLQAMSQADPAIVADSTRNVIATEVAAHIADLTGSSTDETGTVKGWQSALMQLAVINRDGSANLAHVKLVESSIATWAQQHSPTTGLDGTDGIAAFGNYADTLGLLQALVTLQLSRSTQAKVGDYGGIVTAISDGLGAVFSFAPDVAPPLVPFVELAGFAWGAWLNAEQNVIMSRIQGQADITNKQLYAQMAAQTDQLLLAQLIKSDPGFIPKSVQDGGQDSIQRYLSKLSGAHDSNALTSWPELAGDPATLAKAQVVVNLLNDERAQMLSSFSIWAVNDDTDTAP